MKGIYLASCKARHYDYNIVYQDLMNYKYNSDLGGDMLSIDLSCYDYVIASPPCNFWSRARGKRLSQYSKDTWFLLPKTIIKLSTECSNKPFIIENVRNSRKYNLFGIYRLAAKYGLFVYEVGRHIYFTNVFVNLFCEQHFDFKSHGYRVNDDGYNQGGSNVHNVIEVWLKTVCESE